MKFNEDLVKCGDTNHVGTTGEVSHLSLEYKVSIILSVCCEKNLKITTLVKNKDILQRGKLGFSLSLNFLTV